MKRFVVFYRSILLILLTTSTVFAMEQQPTPNPGTRFADFMQEQEQVQTRRKRRRTGLLSKLSSIAASIFHCKNQTQTVPEPPPAEPMPIPQPTIRERIISGQTNFANQDLHGEDLSNLDLRHCNFDNANLTEASLVGANLSNLRLNSTNLTQANLSHAKLNGATLSQVTLVEANLTNAEMNGTIAQQTDLSRALLIGTHLNNIRITDNSKLIGATLCNLSFRNAFIDNINCSFAKCRNINFINSTIQFTDMKHLWWPTATEEPGPAQSIWFNETTLLFVDFDNSNFINFRIFNSGKMGTGLNFAHTEIRESCFIGRKISSLSLAPQERIPELRCIDNGLTFKMRCLLNIATKFDSTVDQDFPLINSAFAYANFKYAKLIRTSFSNMAFCDCELDYLDQIDGSEFSNIYFFYPKLQTTPPLTGDQVIQMLQSSADANPATTENRSHKNTGRILKTHGARVNKECAPDFEVFWGRQPNLLEQLLQTAQHSAIQTAAQLAIRTVLP